MRTKRFLYQNVFCYWNETLNNLFLRSSRNYSFFFFNLFLWITNLYSLDVCCSTDQSIWVSQGSYVLPSASQNKTGVLLVGHQTMFCGTIKLGQIVTLLHGAAKPQWILGWKNACVVNSINAREKAFWVYGVDEHRLWSLKFDSANQIV